VIDASGRSTLPRMAAWCNRAWYYPALAAYGAHQRRAPQLASAHSARSSCACSIFLFLVSGKSIDAVPLISS